MIANHTKISALQRGIPYGDPPLACQRQHHVIQNRAHDRGMGHQDLGLPRALHGMHYQVGLDQHLIAGADYLAQRVPLGCAEPLTVQAHPLEQPAHHGIDRPCATLAVRPGERVLRIALRRPERRVRGVCGDIFVPVYADLAGCEGLDQDKLRISDLTLYKICGYVGARCTVPKAFPGEACLAPTKGNRHPVRRGEFHSFLTTL